MMPGRTHLDFISLPNLMTLSEKLSIGASGKWINAKLSDVSANAYALDLGTLYQATPHWTFAGVLSNIGRSLKFIDQADALPLAFHLGAAYRPDTRWTLSAEGVYQRYGSARGRFGCEWSPLELLSVRAGYRSDTLQDLSALAGFSTGIGLHLWGQELAYAWLPYGELGSTQYLSLVFHFAEPRRNSR